MTNFQWQKMKTQKSDLTSFSGYSSSPRLFDIEIIYSLLESTRQASKTSYWSQSSWRQSRTVALSTPPKFSKNAYRSPWWEWMSFVRPSQVWERPQYSCWPLYTSLRRTPNQYQCLLCATPVNWPSKSKRSMIGLLSTWTKIKCLSMSYMVASPSPPTLSSSSRKHPQSLLEPLVESLPLWEASTWIPVIWNILF